MLCVFPDPPYRHRGREKSVPSPSPEHHPGMLDDLDLDAVNLGPDEAGDCTGNVSSPLRTSKLAGGPDGVPQPIGQAVSEESIVTCPRQCNTSRDGLSGSNEWTLAALGSNYDELILWVVEPAAAMRWFQLQFRMAQIFSLDVWML